MEPLMRRLVSSVPKWPVTGELFTRTVVRPRPSFVQSIKPPRRCSSNTTAKTKPSTGGSSASWNASSEANSAVARRYYQAGSVALTVTVGIIAYNTFYARQGFAETAAEKAEDNVLSNDDGATRFIRLAEVYKHDRNAETYWVIKGTGVYDITEWVPNHPGGEVILRGVGKSIDQYWKLFTIHNKQDVYDILEQYRIGEIDPRDLVDGQVPVDNIEDPFATDPARDERLLQLTSRPCNAETPADNLDEFLTPNHLFYVRNHMWVPAEEDVHKLTIELTDGTEVSYSLEELRSKFKEHHVTAVLQCSGNRRSHMTEGAGKTNGLQWKVGAIGNAVWTGIRLRDVLKDAGLEVDEVPEDVKHAQFMGSEAYGASIPIHKAVDARGDVLLAYGMNGAPLPRDHGYPLRVIVPGTVAARSVKWVNRITLSDEESTSQWQRRDYKCFGPNVAGNPDWDSGCSIQEMPVQSAITRLRTNDGKDGSCKGAMLEGYAFSGGGRRIIRVDISADDGKTWTQADLLDPNERSQGPSEEHTTRTVSSTERSDGTDGPSGDVQKGGAPPSVSVPPELEGAKGSQAWAWQRWRIQVPQEQIGAAFLVKATDESYNTQPESLEAIWNFRGNLASGWHRICMQENGKCEEAKELKAGEFSPRPTPEPATA